MPLFEYRCTACDTQFELLIRAGSAEPSCPSCGSTALEKIISLFAVTTTGTQLKSYDSIRKQQRLDSQKAERARRHEPHDDHHH
jgi:putative FmdB family regulatory protein